MRRRPLRSNGRPFAVRDRLGVFSAPFFFLWPTYGAATPIAVVVMLWSMTTAVEVSCCTSQGSGLSAG